MLRLVSLAGVFVIFWLTASVFDSSARIGLVLLFFPDMGYDYPAGFQLTGLDINDTNFGAMIAWIVSGLAYAVATVALARQWLGQEADKPALPEAAWATDESMNVPGLKR